MLTDARVAALRRRMAEGQADALLVAEVANLRYLTGFEDVLDDDPGAVCVMTADSATFFTDSRYEDAARAAAADTPWTVEIVAGSVDVAALEHLKGRARSLAVESSVAHRRFRRFSEEFGGAVRAVDSWVEEQRQVKEPEELARIAQAAMLADCAVEHVAGVLRAGAVERDVALEIEVFLRRNGSEGVAFAPIVASGPNSARPHSIPGGREMQPGDLVVVDLGARVGGYCSDITRTFSIGPADDAKRELHDAVAAANAAGRSAVRAGLPAKDADTAARAVLEERGLGDAFGHGLGHGVGLEVHELPGVGPRSHDTLRAGAVVTVEPGAYLPGVGGVRIEDLVVVEDGGCRVLSAADRSLIEIA